MNDKEKDLKNAEQAPQSTEGAKDQPQSKPLTWKRVLSKKWAFPAMYMAAAAIILTLMWVYQDAGTQTMKDDFAVSPGGSQAETGEEDALPTNAAQETMRLPFDEKNEIQIVLEYYDKNASNDVRQAALVEYGGTFTPHMGIDYSHPDNEPFDVLAVMSGKVTRVEKNHPVVGNYVEITHSNGLVSVYQSLADIQVTKDAEVRQGDIIAKAGRNELEKEQGAHLHFELRQGQDGPTVNPSQYLGQQ